MDKITDARGGQNNGGKLGEIFLHPCLLLRKNFKIEGWREDGLTWFSGFRKELLPEEVLGFIIFFCKTTVECSSPSAVLNIDVCLISLPLINFAEHTSMHLQNNIYFC